MDIQRVRALFYIFRTGYQFLHVRLVTGPLRIYSEVFLTFGILRPRLREPEPPSLRLTEHYQYSFYQVGPTLPTLPERALQEMMEALPNTTTLNLLGIYPTCT